MVFWSCVWARHSWALIFLLSSAWAVRSMHHCTFLLSTKFWGISEPSGLEIWTCRRSCWCLSRLWSVRFISVCCWAESRWDHSFFCPFYLSHTCWGIVNRNLRACSWVATETKRCDHQWAHLWVKSFIWLYKLFLNVQILREAVDVKGVLHLESCYQLSSKRVALSSKLYLLIHTIFIDFKMCLLSFKLFIAAWAVSWKIQKACAACLLKSLFQLKLYYIAFIILSYYSTFNSLHSSNNNQII